jgi:hypothetical protein
MAYVQRPKCQCYLPLLLIDSVSKRLNEGCLETSNFEIMATNTLNEAFIHLRNGATSNRNLHMYHDNVNKNGDNDLSGVRQGVTFKTCCIAFKTSLTPIYCTPRDV